MFSLNKNLILAATLMAALLAAHPSRALADATDADIAIGLDASLLQTAMKIEPQQVATPIDRYAAGVYTSGTAITNASVTAAPWPVSGGLGLTLTMSSVTNAYALSQTQPRPAIFVDFDTAVDTWATTWKQVYLAEDGFHMQPAQSSAQTAITLLNLDASAWGLFWRFKQRIAYQQAYAQIMAQKATQEYQTSVEIAAQLNAQIDERTATMLAPLNARYQDRVLNAVILPGGYSGDTHFTTMGDRFLIALGGGAPDFPELSPDVPLAARIGPAGIERIVGAKLAGRAMKGDELLAMLPDTTNDDGSNSRDDYQRAAAAVDLQFASAACVGAHFGDDAMQLTFRLSRLSMEGHEFHDVALTYGIATFRDGPATLIDLDGSIDVLVGSAVPAAADKKVLVSAARKLLPPIAMDLSTKTFDAGMIQLRLKELKAAPGMLTLSLTPSQGTPPAPHAGTATPAAWCVAAGGTWTDPDCACGSMWYRSDAIQHFGQTDFTVRCRQSLGLQ